MRSATRTARRILAGQVIRRAPRDPRPFSTAEHVAIVVVTAILLALVIAGARAVGL